MEAFTLTQWVIVLLVFVLGLVLGMFLFAGGKWKRRYRDEIARREELERDNERYRRENAEFTSLRGAATKGTVARDDTRGPL